MWWYYVELAALGLSLSGILGLFALKSYEIARGSRIAPGFRDILDNRAITLKEHLYALTNTISNRTIPTISIIGRWIVHKMALGVAFAARTVERTAKSFAERIAQRHILRGSQSAHSEFLKQVAQAKTSSGNIDDSTV